MDRPKVAGDGGLLLIGLGFIVKNRAGEEASERRVPDTEAAAGSWYSCSAHRAGPDVSAPHTSRR